MYIENLCGDTTMYYQYVEVYEAPTALFGVPSPLCVGEQFTLTNVTQPGIGIGCNTNTTYTWDFGDGNTSVLTNPIHTYADAGLYNITLTAYSTPECFDDTTIQVYVTGVHAEFPNDSVCFGASTTFNGTAWGYDDPLRTPNPAVPIISYYWDFGTGATSTQEDPVYPFPTPGFHTVSFTATNQFGCDTTVTQTIYIGQMDIDTVIVESSGSSLIRLQLMPSLLCSAVHLFPARVSFTQYGTVKPTSLTSSLLPPVEARR